MSFFGAWKYIVGNVNRNSFLKLRRISHSLLNLFVRLGSGIYIIEIQQKTNEKYYMI